MDDFKEKVLLELKREEERLIKEHTRATEARDKNPRRIQYDEEISYTSGALGEVYHIRAIIKELMK